MKQKDVALIIVVVFFAGISSFIISGIFFTGGGNRDQKAEVVQPISAQFKQPDKNVFNENAINPTKLIQIGDTTNPQPF